MVIYKITNKITDDIYIGQTINDLSSRWKQHCSKNSCCRKLKNAIQKYGNIKEAVLQLGLNYGSLRVRVQQGKSHKDYIFKYVNEENISV